MKDILGYLKMKRFSSDNWLGKNDVLDVAIGQIQLDANRIAELEAQLAAYKESNENLMNGFKELNTEVSKLKDREKKMLTTLEACSTPNAGYLARQILNELKGNG